MLYDEPHTISVDRHQVELTHCTKLLFPADNITKGGLVDYYLTIAPHMLPFIKNRPLTLQRFVNGITHEGFYQKDAGDYFPQWLKQVKVAKKSGGSTHYVIANNAATLAYLTNQVTITYHAWLCTANALNTPDKMIFDLDPAGKATFADVKFVAHVLHDYFVVRDVIPLCMLTGSRGIHVIVPLKKEHGFDTVRATARTIAEWCVAQHPTQITLESRLSKRGNKIYLDILRNAYGQTAVAPYSVRARPHAPVATPVSWEELFGGQIKKSDQFTIHSVLKRLENTHPWQLTQKYSLKHLAS